MSQSNSLKILLIPFPDFDTLDLYAPIECLDIGGSIGGLNITFDVAAIRQPTLSHAKVPVHPNLTIAQAMQQLDQYEIVIQPGAGVPSVQKYLKEPETLGIDPKAVKQHLDLLLAFSQLTTLSPRGCQRVLMSICTGALVVGLSGAFGGKTVTTHYEGLKQLKDNCQEAGKGPTTVLPDIGAGGWEGFAAATKGSWRWVTTYQPDGVTVISSGGISCGMDASLFLVSELQVWKDGKTEKIGVAKAHEAARIMEYAWRWA
ncbi:hypothetical protein AJ79_04600 [Helicocarpus griseus UAMH5409]|uniref:DJ-1/PfpI domain-containing protein n=1 Tax=Helicocarpus griseus UAMH5409 TaxID=1447875 RepID=A0A2B7XTJ6_9EURO|nr:hypothetical protein AJ79_04600 [Helicocarpus griseus UAMH5409]